MTAETSPVQTPRTGARGVAPPCCPVLEAPLSDEEAEGTARVFQALAEPTRIKLLSLIASSPTGERCVCELTEPLRLRQPTVSHHLRVLVEAGLLHRERRGSWAYFRLDHRALDAASRALTPPGTSVSR